MCVQITGIQCEELFMHIFPLNFYYTESKVYTPKQPYTGALWTMLF
jgi:hypothetical protein